VILVTLMGPPVPHTACCQPKVMDVLKPEYKALNYIEIRGVRTDSADG